MTNPKAAPEIFQIPFAEIDPAILSTEHAPGSPEFEQAVIMHYALNHATKQFLPILIDTQTGDSKDRSVELIKAAAEQTQADFVFTIMEAWGLPKNKMPRYQEIMDKYGSVGASPYKIDTAAFMLETRYGVWGCQVTLKPKGSSKKKHTFGKVELQFMDGVEGRFVGLLSHVEKQHLH